MAQIIKIKRGSISSLVSSTPTLQQGELLLATGSVSGLGSTFFVADAANSPELPYAKVESISNGPALAASLDANFTGLLIHSASDNKLYRYSGTAFEELAIAAGSFVGTLPVTNGGTGQTSFTNGQLLIGNTTGNTLTKATLTEGAGIDITNGTGTITIAAETATTTNPGIVELATTAEVTTGTDTARAVTPDALKDGYQGSTNVTTLGTIGTGTWQGTAIADGYISSATTWNNKLDSSGTIATNDYAKFDASGDLIGRSYTEVKSDLSLNNVENTALSTWAGSSNITTLGTISTGVWQGSAISTAYISNLSGTNTGDESDASTTVKGIVELATTAETTTGTDTTRAVTPDGLKDGYQGSTNVTTLGTITTGTWNGTAIASTYIGSHTHAASDITEISNLTAAEGAQLENINTVTISNTQWGYLGASNQGIATSNSPTFAGLTVTGDLSVQGTLTTVNSSEVQLGDRIITLNTADSAGDAGIQVHDTSTNQTGSLLWDTSGDYWKVGISGSTDYRLVEWDGETVGAGDFIHTDSNGRINAINTSTDGDLLISDGDGTFTVTNVIDGGTF